jgi:putative DNA-invertase from lambdoid prophage Rac
MNNHTDALRLEILRQFQMGNLTSADASDLLSRMNNAPPAHAADPDHIGTIHSYSRVSNKDQVVNMTKESHEQQAASYADYLIAKFGGLKTGQYFFDPGVSAFKKQLIAREEGRRMHMMLRPGDHVVFCRLDRAFRNTRDFLDTYAIWQRMNVRIHFLDLGIDLDTATGKLFATILAAMAEWDSARKSEARLANNKLAREQGRKIGRHTRRGHRVVKHKGKIIEIPDRRKHAIAKYIWLLHEQAGLSFEKISDRLEALVAKREGRKAARRWEKREWSRGTCHNWWKDYKAGKFSTTRSITNESGAPG